MAGVLNRQPAPMPTAAPRQRLVHARLGIRQNEQTCGWATSLTNNNGGPTTNSFAMICSSGYLCAHNDELQVEGCCPSDQNISSCRIDTECLDATAANSLGGTASPGTLICTEAGWPFCATVIYSGNGYSSWFCSRSPATVSGILGDSPPTPAAVTSSTTSLDTDTSTSTQSPTSALTSTTVSSTTSTPSLSPNTSNTSSSSSSPLSTGAIVGIAIGGIVLILGMLGFIYFMRRLSQKKQNTDPQEASRRWTMPEQQEDRWSNTKMGNYSDLGTYVSPVSSPAMSSARN